MYTCKRKKLSVIHLINPSLHTSCASLYITNTTSSYSSPSTSASTGSVACGGIYSIPSRGAYWKGAVSMNTCTWNRSILRSPELSSYCQRRTWGMWRYSQPSTKVTIYTRETKKIKWNWEDTLKYSTVLRKEVRQQNVDTKFTLTANNFSAYLLMW